MLSTDRICLETSLTSIGNGVDLDEIHPVVRKSILVVDDEPENVTLLKRIFINEGYNVSGALSGEEALRKLTWINPAIVILDLMMPGLTGEETFDAMRKIMDVPVIILSADNHKEDVVRMLQNGVDDYITKPFNDAELTARVSAVLRRSERTATVTVLTFPNLDLTIDLETYEVTYHGTRIQLTGKMFEVLALLAKNAPKVVNYHDLTQKVWGENSPSVRNRLKYLVYLLRQEFSNIDPTSDIIKNIDRLGYKLISEGQ